MSISAAHPSCDRAIAHAAGHRGAAAGEAVAAHPRAVLATTILASSMAFVDGSVVNVALPAIGQSLAASGRGLSWVMSGYLLPLSALLLVGGAAGDAFGRTRLLTTGIALFAIASLLCTVAPNLGWFLAGRVMQGTGAALLLPNSLAILGTSFRGEARGRAIGTWAAVGAAAGAVGPLLGGYLVDIAGFRPIFFINLPIAITAIALSTRYVRDGRNGDHARPDLIGAGLAVAALTALTSGLTEASSSRGADPWAWAALVAGAALITLFRRVERRRADRAMMPLELFASRAFVGLNLLTFLLYGAIGGILLLVPYVLIEAHGWAAAAAGAALLPMPLLIALLSSQIGQLAAKSGPRLPLTMGPLLASLGCVLAIGVAGHGSYWTTTLPAMLVISLGMAGAVAPLTNAVLTSVAEPHTGVASGFNSAVARTGGLVASALASAVFAADGPAMLRLFRSAAIVAALAALAAGASAFLALPPPSPGRSRRR